MHLAAFTPAASTPASAFASATVRGLLAACLMAWSASTMADAGGTSGRAAQSAGAVVASAQIPSIEILQAQTHLAGACAGATFDLNTFINVDTHASADVRLVTPGVGVLEEFTDDTGSNIGPYNGSYATFHILGFGGGIPPHAPIQLNITTYSGPALSGRSSYVSTVTFDCTTGVIASIANSATGELPPVPALADASLAALASVLGIMGVFLLRRRAVRVR